MFQTGEWGFALGSAYWGSGLFLDAARHVLDFAFDDVGVLRLEARAAVVNGRGNGALRKTGAVQEGVLRRSFHRGGQFHDQVLWSILAGGLAPATRSAVGSRSLAVVGRRRTCWLGHSRDARAFFACPPRR